jgi:hypothetical protein
MCATRPLRLFKWMPYKLYNEIYNGLYTHIPVGRALRAGALRAGTLRAGACTPALATLARASPGPPHRRLNAATIPIVQIPAGRRGGSIVAAPSLTHSGPPSRPPKWTRVEGRLTNVHASVLLTKREALATVTIYREGARETPVRWRRRFGGGAASAALLPSRHPLRNSLRPNASPVLRGERQTSTPET